MFGNTWKYYFPPPHNRKTTKTPPPTPPQQQQQNQRSKRERVKNQNHKQILLQKFQTRTRTNRCEWVRRGSSLGSRCEWLRQGSLVEWVRWCEWVRQGSSWFVGASGFATISLLSLSLSSRVVRKWWDDLNDRWLGSTRLDRSGFGCWKSFFLSLVVLSLARSFFDCFFLFFLSRVFSVFSLPLSAFCKTRKWIEVKMKAEIHFRGQGWKFRSTGNQFPENNVFRDSQTQNFPEIDFRNWFEVDSNAPLVILDNNNITKKEMKWFSILQWSDESTISKKIFKLAFSYKWSSYLSFNFIS